MAIDNKLKGDLSNIQNTVKNRDQLQSVVSDTLLGLLNNRSDKVIIADSSFLHQIKSLGDKGLDLSTEITNISSVINTQRRGGTLTGTTTTYYAFGAANNATAYTITDATETSRLLQKIQGDLGHLQFQKSQAESNLQQEISGRDSALRGKSGNVAVNTSTFDRKIDQYRKELSKIGIDISECERLIPLLEKLLNIQNLEIAIGPDITARKTEITSITNIMEQDFLINKPEYLPKILIGPFTLGDSFTTSTLGRGFDATTHSFDLRHIFTNRTTPGANPIAYELCDNEGQELVKENGNAKRTVKLASGETVTLKGLSIDSSNQLIGQNITIEPLENIKFPVTIELQVRGRIQEPNTGILLDNYKPLTLTINTPTLSQSDREQAYDGVNAALGQNTIHNRINSVYTANNKNRENEVIRNILRAGGNKEEVDKVFNDPKLKELFEERFRALPGLVPVFAANQLVTGFRTHMVDINKQVPPQYLTNINAFTDYIRNNMETNIQEYLKDQIKNTIENRSTPGGINNRDRIISTFMQFQTDVANNKLDNNDHMQILQNLPNEQPQGQPNGFWQRVFRRRSNTNNYTKFFAGKTAEVANQQVEMEDKTIKYGIKLHVSGVNKMSVSIDIDGEDEPLIIDAANHTQLIQAILSRASTKSGEPMGKKARCHMAVSTIKALVKMSPVSLHRAFNGQIVSTDRNTYNVDRLETMVKGDNLIMRANCISDNPNRTRTNRIIFDEARFKSMHNVDELENGVNALSGQINGIMNSMADEFRTATSRIKPGPLMKYDTGFPLRFGWAKRLYGKRKYDETNYNFDFSTSVSEGGKSVNIKFENGKFVVSGTHKDKPFELTDTNLGAILRTVRAKDRLFDGVELAVVEKVNEEMIKSLRKNIFVSSENYVVSDLNPNKTGRVYVFDSSGELSYLDVEDRNRNPLGAGKTHGTIKEDHLPPHRVRCNARERKEFMQNPLLGGRLVRSMRLQLALF